MKISPRLLSTAILLAVVSFCGAREIVFASYNIENYLTMPRSSGDGVRIDKPKPEAEIQAGLSILGKIKPDILGIVEMGDEAMLRDFQSRLRQHGLNYDFTEWVQGDDATRHLALLSKFPIFQRHSRGDIPLDLDGRRFRMARGILDVTIDVSPTYKLRVVGLHLKSRRPVPEYDEKKFRAREAMAVRAHLDGVLKNNPNENLIVFGDLNDTKNEFPVIEILGPAKSPLGLRDIPLQDAQGMTWTHYWKTADIYSRVDYLLSSRGLWPEVLPRKSGIDSSPKWRQASDHRAIYTTLSITE